MLSTTSAFDTAIKADARKITARVKINYTDAFLDPTITAEPIGTDIINEADTLIITEDDQALKTEGNNLVSYPDQAVNGRPVTTYKWFSLETDDYVNNMITQDGQDIITEDAVDFFELETDYAQPLNKLDGTWHFMPGTEELATFNEVGWWGDNVSASDSSVPGDQGLKVELSARRVTSFQITGDDKRNEYPVDFSVEFYAGASLEGTENVSSNTLVTYSQNITALDNITSIVLHVDTWSHPYKVPKITEFVTSLFETYTASDIKSFNVIEQREISNDNSVPTGNIASNECDLSLMNNSRKFDAGNTSSPLYGLVKPNNKVDIEVGVLTSSGGFEYVPVFTGWTGGWNVPDSDLIASVSARDRLEILRKSYITTSTVITNDTFKDWFTTVLSDAGLAVTEYEIDPVLDGSIYTVPYGWFEDVSHREALEILATSCSAAVFVDRNGCIQVKSVDYFETNNLDSVLTYDRSEYMDKSNQPIYENIVNKISVTTQPIEKTTSVTVYQTLSSDKETIAANSVTEYNITYRDKPVSDGVPTIDPAVSGVTVTDSNLYAWGGTVEVTNTNSSSKDFQIKVVGSTYDVAGQKTITAQDDDSINDNGTFFLNYKSNDFLQDTNLAGKIANTLLKSFKDPQRDLTITFSPGGNPALENDDRISITDLYGTKEYNLVSQRINYDGGLNIEQKGRVVGNIFVLITESGDNIITEDDLLIVLE